MYVFPHLYDICGQYILKEKQISKQKEKESQRRRHFGR